MALEALFQHPPHFLKPRIVSNGIKHFFCFLKRSSFLFHLCSIYYPFLFQVSPTDKMYFQIFRQNIEAEIRCQQDTDLE